MSPLPSPAPIPVLLPQLVSCPDCGTVLRYVGDTVPEGPCPACGSYVCLALMPLEPALVTPRAAPVPTPPPANTRAAVPPVTVTPITRRADWPSGDFSHLPPSQSATAVAPGPRPAAPSIACPATPDPHARKPSPRERLANLPGYLDTLGGQAIASGVLVGMVVLCVMLFLKLDKKRSAQAIARSLPVPVKVAPAPAPTRKAAPATLPLPELPAFGDDAVPPSLETDSAASSSTVRIESGGTPADQLSMDDLRERR